MPSASAELAKGFESLRKRLLEPQYADRLERPLAFWASSNDRRLPWALLERPLRTLLSTPFDKLIATPSVGPKKVNTLLSLLARAAEDEQAMADFGNHRPVDSAPAVTLPVGAGAKFDPARVTDAMWAQWREAVRHHGLDEEPLGRVFPMLRTLPTVMWDTPLAEYASHTLAEIRKRKTHGAKRVQMILETFYLVYQALARVSPLDHLSVRLVPRFVPPVERWLLGAMSNGHLPSPAEVRAELTLPLVQQLHHDAQGVVAKLAEERLGLKGAPQTVRQQAKKVSVTRARVYQLLEECGRIMDVRWPCGRMLIDGLGKKYRAVALASNVDSTLFRATAELFYPTRPLRTEDALEEE